MKLDAEGREIPEQDYLNHDYLQEFLTVTGYSDCYVTNAMKCILAQILHGVRFEVAKVTRVSETITAPELLDIQIKHLRMAIVDLEKVKNLHKTQEGTIQ